MGIVYLLLSVDVTGNEVYKIGVTKNTTTKRISQLSTGNSDRIQLLKEYKSKNYKKIEKMLHVKYAPYKTEANNEWFSLEASDVISFLYECKKADDTISFLLKNNPFYK